MKRFWLALIAIFIAAPAYGQSSVRPCWYNSSGICTYVSVANPFPVQLQSSGSTIDPCAFGQKSSVAINISSATTTSLVAVSGTTAVYVCGGSITIAGSATSADSAQIEYGTGAACTGTHALTGVMGSGDAAVSTTPTVVQFGGGSSTSMTAPASNGVCLVSAGTTVSIQGWLSYIQQ
jgi:hypothetical protein